MNLIIMKLLLAVFASFSGYFLLKQIVGTQEAAFVGFVSGLLIALAAIKFEERVNKTPLRVVMGGAMGLILGLILANLSTYSVMQFIDNPYLELSVYAFTNCVIGYLGLSIGMKKGDEFEWDMLQGFMNGKGGMSKKEAPSMVIDTSVLIDGRLADICQTGFIDGKLIVPRFVLEELHYIADSQDTLKKTRGTRGLDILEELQKDELLEVEISYEVFPDVKQVDMKLVSFAKKYGAKILTNDINLNKVAKLHGVKVLNINNLANALKPVILPGEVLTLPIQKGGKEAGQGIGYLDDGTMVVVDNGSSHVGKTMKVAVTSILQTTTGRMIFSKIQEEAKKAPPVLGAVK